MAHIFSNGDLLIVKNETVPENYELKTPPALYQLKIDPCKFREFKVSKCCKTARMTCSIVNKIILRKVCYECKSRESWIRQRDLDSGKRSVIR